MGISKDLEYLGMQMDKNMKGLEEKIKNMEKEC